MTALPADRIVAIPRMMPDASKFSMTRPPRPMLARDADAVYWLSRYVERAEHVARILLVNSNLLIDVGDLAPELQRQQWESVLRIMRLGELPAGDGPVPARIAQYMVFNLDENPSSLLSCISRARDNARGIRETISAEMWENLNTLYWSLRSEDAPARFEESPEDFYRGVMTGSMLFQGLTDQTLPHDQRWMFAQLGKYLERLDVTSRILETKFTLLKAAERFLETPIKNIHWMGVLRCCCSIEAFRRQHIGDMDPIKAAAFLTLEPEFPRSIRFCVAKAHEAVASIRRDVNPRRIDQAERILGRLHAQLEFAEVSELLERGVAAYQQGIQQLAAEAALALQREYFLH